LASTWTGTASLQNIYADLRRSGRLEFTLAAREWRLCVELAEALIKAT
jgi:hypothetical protein